MLIEIILALLLGISAGTITGLIPGIHINLIGIFLVSLSVTFLSKIPSTYLVTFIVAMAITHTFLDFIPSVFLGCPDTDTELSILPGHKLLKKGLGYAAVALTAYGSLAAIFLLVILAFPSVILIEKINPLIKNLLPYILILVLILLILLERKKLTALGIILLTGTLGLIVLNLDTLNQPLLPLLTGLFGSSSILISIKNKTKIPKQKIINPSTKILKPLIGATIAAPLCSFLPGLGSGQAAVIGNTIVKNKQKEFLVLIGATNTLVMGFSFIFLYIISRARTGAAIAIQEIIGIPSTKILLLIIIVTFITGIISFFLTLQIAKFFSLKMQKINYTILSSITLLILISIVFLISGIFGFFILLISTATGIYCIQQKVKRTNMMGCLLIPTIVFYLF